MGAGNDVNASIAMSAWDARSGRGGGGSDPLMGRSKSWV